MSVGEILSVCAIGLHESCHRSGIDCQPSSWYTTCPSFV